MLSVVKQECDKMLETSVNNATLGLNNSPSPSIIYTHTHTHTLLHRIFCHKKTCHDLYTYVGRNSSVGIATLYGLDGPGIEPRWLSRFSARIQPCPGAHPASYTVCTSSIQEVKLPGRGFGH